MIITAAGTYVVSGEVDGRVAHGERGRCGQGADRAKRRLHSQRGGIGAEHPAGRQGVRDLGRRFAEHVGRRQATLAEGEDEPNAALYSKADLTINGTGALTVEGQLPPRRELQDDLVVTGGIAVTAKEDGCAEGLRESGRRLSPSRLEATA